MISSTKQIKVANIDNLEIYPEKRDCYSQIVDFVNSGKGKRGQICAIYGLRRTGKTVLLSQTAKDLKDKGLKCLYLICSDEEENIARDKENGIKHISEMVELYNILDKAIEEKYQYLFIDEITFIKDFVGQSNLISNYYANQGLNIITTGTNSLSFVIASQDDLYDRLKMIKTSYISFEEYNRILGKNIDDYIQYGGTLTEESPYKDYSTTIKYTNTAIVKNIVSSIHNSEHNNSQALTLLYADKDIVSTIHRCVNQMNQDFLISAINRNKGIFESHPLHLGINNARQFPYAKYIDVLSVDEEVKTSLSILYRDEMCIKMEQSDIDIIVQALQDLDLVLSVPTYLSVNKEYVEKGRDMKIVSQAGMLYCHSTELLKILTNDDNWQKLEECGLENKYAFMNRVDRQVKGDILENIILYDTYNSLNKDYYVTKIRRKKDNKEVDLVVVDKISKETYLFEVKYADYLDKSQIKNLSSKDFIQYISDNFGEIKGRYVVYNGKFNIIDDDLGRVKYIPAEVYLKNIVKSKNIDDFLRRINQDTNASNNSLEFGLEKVAKKQKTKQNNNGR